MCLVNIASFAQGVGAIKGKYCDYIFCGNKLPKNFKYTVQSSKGEVVDIEFPESAEKFIARVRSFNSANPFMIEKSDSVLTNYWQWATGFTLTDSLPLEAKSLDILYGLGVLQFFSHIEQDQSITYQLLSNSNRQNLTLVSGRFNTSKTLQFQQFETSDKYIIADWKGPVNVPLYQVKAMKQYANQDELSETEMPIYVSYRKDSCYIRLMDTSVIKGLKYNYALKLINVYGDELDVNPPVSVLFRPKNSIPIILHFKATDISDKYAVKLVWKLASTDLVQSCDIYRSELFDSAYQLVGTANSTDTMFVDYNVKAAKANWYQLVINTPFERGVNSAKVSGILKKDANAKELSVINAYNINGKITVRWLNETTEARGYYVYRRQKGIGEWQLISPLLFHTDTSNFFEYADTTEQLSMGNEYEYTVRILSKGYALGSFNKVATVYGNFIESLPTLTELNGMFDQNKILLTWRFADNHQVAEFEILRRIVGEKDFTSLAYISSTLNSYLDTNITIGKTYQYQLLPIDINGRSNAKYDIEVEAKAPTVFAPEIFKVDVLDNGVKLYWESTKQANVNAINVYRIEGNKGATLVAKLGESDESYIDKTIKKGVEYYYYTTVVAYGIESEASTPNRVKID